MGSEENKCFASLSYHQAALALWVLSIKLIPFLAEPGGWLCSAINFPFVSMVGGGGHFDSFFLRKKSITYLKREKINAVIVKLPEELNHL